jgi:hypothetical protein
MMSSPIFGSPSWYLEKASQLLTPSRQTYITISFSFSHAFRWSTTNHNSRLPELGEKEQVSLLFFGGSKAVKE